MKASIALLWSLALLPRLLAEEGGVTTPHSEEDGNRHQESDTIHPPQKYPSVTMEAATAVASQRIMEDESLTRLPPHQHVWHNTAATVEIPFRPLSPFFSREASDVFEPLARLDSEQDYDCCHAHPDIIEHMSGDDRDASLAVNRTQPQHHRNSSSNGTLAHSPENQPIPDGAAVEEEEPLNDDVLSRNPTEEAKSDNITQFPSEDEASVTDTDQVSPDSSQEEIIKEEEEEVVATTESEESPTVNDPQPQSPPPQEEDDKQAEVLVVDYASKSAGAQVIEKSPGWSGTSDLLTADNDRYAMVPTALDANVPKILVLALSEEILVKQVILTNYERYSSHVKEFQIWGSQTMAHWVDLGHYTAQPPSSAGQQQVFDLVPATTTAETGDHHPAASGAQYWARYLKFKFLSHYGDEHYLTITQIRVHGSTMQQGFQEHWEEEEKQHLLQEEETTNPPVANESEGTKETTINEGNVETPSATDLSKDKDAEESLSLPDQSHESTEVSSSSSTTEPESEVPPQNGGSDETNDSETVANSNTTPTERKDEIPNAEVVTPGTSDNVQSMATQSRANYNQELCRDQISLVDEQGYLVHTSGTFAEAWSRIVEQGANCSLGEFSALTLRAKHSTAVRSSVERWVIRAHTLERNPVLPVAVSPLLVTNTQELPLKTGRLCWTETGKDGVSAKVSRVVVEKLLSRLKKETDAPSDLVAAITPSWSVASTAPTTSMDPVKDDFASVSNDEVQASSAKAKGGDVTQEAEHAAVNTPVVDKQTAKDTEESHQESKSTDVTVNTPKETSSSSMLVEDSRAMNLLMERVPSASCLNDLDIAQQKLKILNSRSSGTGSMSNGPSSGGMEPIFKKLTDEIKSLQAALSVHDKFSKDLVSCFQRVLLDLLLQQELERVEQRDRLEQLEQQMMRGDWVYRVIVDFAVTAGSAISTAVSSLIEFVLVQVSSLEKTIMIVYLHQSLHPWIEMTRLWVLKNQHRVWSSTSCLFGFPISLMCMVLFRRYRLRRSRPLRKAAPQAS